jgi:heptaprenyl diphosphate synthase
MSELPHQSDLGGHALTGADLLGADWSATGALADSCRYAVAQTGKQLRSRLVLAASRLGNREDPQVHTACRAVELLHVASLVHDDVIDDSPLRRGRASLEHEWGTFAAGYTGAWLFGSAAELATSFDRETIGLFADTVCELCNGEMRELLDLHDSHRQADSYLAAIAGKTASLFSLSARLGGIAGGAPPATCSLLGRYGQSLGMAFQLADDILDLLGRRDGGKRRGDDVRRGLFTLPVIYALQDDPSLQSVLAGEIGDETVEAIVASVHASGAFTRAIAACERYGDDARGLAGELQAPWLVTFVDEALAPLDARQGAVAP